MSVDKLVNSAQLDLDLTSIANAIRTKGGTSASLTFPNDFVSAINAISGSSETTRTIIIPEQTITTSSTYTQITLFTKGFVIGEEYIYTINGTTLTATCRDFYGSNMVGNTSTNTFFEYTPNTGAMYFTVNDSSLYGTYTIKVEQAIDTNGYTRTVIAEEQTVTPVSTSSNDSTYYSATLNVSEGFEADAEYIITLNDTEYFFTCQVLWGTNYLLGEINYFYGGSDFPYPFGIIWISGTTCTIARDNGNQVTVKIEKLELTGSGGTGQTATGTVTGDGTSILEIPCNFAPDLIYVYGDMSGDVANRGITSATIIKDVAIYVSSDTSASSADEYATVLHGITGYNESNTSAVHATYSNGILTINTVSNSSSGKWRSGQVYNYKLSTIGTGAGSSSPTFVTKEITVNGTYTASNDSADGYSSVTVNVPSSGITPTGSINITTNGTHDVTNYASAVVSVSGGGGSSATKHTIHFDFSDETDTDIDVYYDDALLGTMITAYMPVTYGQKTVTLAQLDGVTWYELTNIPINTQLVDYNEVRTGYTIDPNGSIVSSDEWNCVTDYLPINGTMTFSFSCDQWAYIGFYDNNKNAIRVIVADEIKTSAVDYVVSGTLDPSIIPPNAMYVVLRGNSYSIENLSLIRTV